MPILLDTSVLLAAAVQRESRHSDAAEAMRRLDDGLVVPITILTETLCFVGTRYGLTYQRRLWDGVSTSGIEVVQVGPEALGRVRQIESKYADAGFGFADCTLLAVCEEMRTARILSFDRRLAAYKPSFAPSLEVLP